MTAGGETPTVAGLLKGKFARERAGALRSFWLSEQDRLLGAGVPGDEVAVHLAKLMDEIIRTLCEDVSDDFAVMAVGGYGQGRLAPFSDIDLLILTPNDQQEGAAPDFIYTLWDMGVVPAQAIHTVQSAIAAAVEELDTRTSFLDARPVCGNESLMREFHAAYEELRKRTIPEYFQAKLEEQRLRHEDADNSTYAIEPDVKRGRGGVRDLQTLFWLGRYLEGQDNFSLSTILAPREIRRIGKLEEFFWSVRVHLHKVAGRGDDKLYFPLQRDIATRLGFYENDHASKVDRFMRYYFLAAQETSRLTGVAIRRLERRALGDGKLPKGKSVDSHPGIVAVKGRAAFAKEITNPDALNCLELFHACGLLGLPIHFEAFTAVARASRRFTFRGLQTRQITDRFTDILRDSAKLEPVLRQMAETGFLGRMLPAFGGIVGRAEHGLFRRFTLDDHVLRSISVLDRICADDGEFSGTVFLDRAREFRPTLVFALLIQEMPAAMVRPSVQRIRRRITQRVGFILDDKEAAKLIAFAILNRSLLVRTATRREVAAPEMLEGVATTIGTVDRLAFLSLFTLCRQYEAGVGSWEEYSHRDVRLLVQLLNIQITGGSTAVSLFLNGRSQGLRDQVAAKVGSGRMAAFDALVEAAGPAFWTSADVPAATRLAALMAEPGPEEAGRSAVYADEEGFLNIIVYSEDRLTLFAECAGLAAMRGGSVFGARGYAFVHQGQHRGVILMQIQRAGTPPEPFDPADIESLGIAEDFDAIAQGHPPKISLPPPSVRDRRHVFEVEPSIRMDKDASNDALVVEVEARDRPGLLYLLVSHLSEIGVDTSYALVATYGHRAVDTFYLRDYPGYKIEDPRRIEVIRRQIMRALSDDAADSALIRTGA
ncbi:nucleotidyltransferase domain-containing protein [Parvularcula marina]|uniref:[protein-PII] uridylyltransferase family protein n=1 Tax=Parvularcula marina TaxID=2292771 RepID=UPI003518422C